MEAIPDPIFADPRLARVYDYVDDDRADLLAYVALVDEFSAVSVLDVGCGTGTFACDLARDGKEVVGVDPPWASLEVARRKPYADGVRWIHATASHLPPLVVDLITMTGNVAQVFLTDAEWTGVLGSARRAMQPAGRLVFETRDPSRRAWETWNKEESRRRVYVPEVGPVDTWVEVTMVQLPYVSFRHTFVFETDRTVLTSDSTLRFRERDEITASLTGAGLEICEIRDAPDRVGLELVFIVQRDDHGAPASSGSW